MPLILELPADLEAEAAKISDLKERMTSFLRHQVDLEKWRAGRYSEAERKLVAKSALEAKGLTREQASADFMEVYDRITRQL